MASASHDLSARLTQVSLSPGSSSESAQVLASLHLHTSALTSISATQTGKHLLTTSYDGLIGFWDTSIPGKDEVPLEEPRVVLEGKEVRVGEEENRSRISGSAEVSCKHVNKVERIHEHSKTYLAELGFASRRGRSILSSLKDIQMR